MWFAVAAPAVAEACVSGVRALRVLEKRGEHLPQTVEPPGAAPRCIHCSAAKLRNLHGGGQWAPQLDAGFVIERVPTHGHLPAVLLPSGRQRSFVFSGLFGFAFWVSGCGNHMNAPRG